MIRGRLHIVAARYADGFVGFDVVDGYKDEYGDWQQDDVLTRLEPHRQEQFQSFIDDVNAILDVVETKDV